METILLIETKNNLNLSNYIHIGSNPYLILESNQNINELLSNFKDEIISTKYLPISNKKLFNLLEYSKTKARIEPGAIIRENVTLDDTSIILMGAIVNINSSIGANTMIDMNAVIGSGVIIKDNCHIGAGAVIAGVLEPVSTKPVVINNNVFIGANAVILEGVTIGENSIIGAGCIVTKDIPNDTTIYENKSYIIKNNNQQILNKTALNMELRK